MTRKEKRDLVKEYRRTMKHIKKLKKALSNNPPTKSIEYGKIWNGYINLICHRAHLYEIIYSEDRGFRSNWREGRRDALGYKVRWKQNG